MLHFVADEKSAVGKKKYNIQLKIKNRLKV